MRQILRQLILVLVACAVALFGPVGPARADPALPTVTSWPLHGVPQVVRGFDPPTTPWGAGHRGVDLAGQVGDQVLAAAAGTVTYAGMLAGRGVIVVDHGTIRTTYEPVSPTVSVGTPVAAGDPIGTLDAGHCADQPCLHWGLKQGAKYLDPLLLAPTGSAGGSYRLVPASERTAAARRAADRQVLQQSLAAYAAVASGGREAPAGSHGFDFPVAAPITSPYGMRFHPVLHIWELHDGTDLGAACGTPIESPYSGTVTQEYFNVGYGNRLIIDNGRIDGHYITTSMNHAERYIVHPGQHVRQGQVLGYVGATGFATGCHLHLMVWRDGTKINPMLWF